MFFPFVCFFLNFILINITVFHNYFIRFIRDIHILYNFFWLLFQRLHLGWPFWHHSYVLFALEVLWTPWTLYQLAGLVVVVTWWLQRTFFLVVFLAFDRFAAVRKLRSFLFFYHLVMALYPDLLVLLEIFLSLVPDVLKTLLVDVFVCKKARCFWM